MCVCHHVVGGLLFKVRVSDLTCQGDPELEAEVLFARSPTFVVHVYDTASDGQIGNLWLNLQNKKIYNTYAKKNNIYSLKILKQAKKEGVDLICHI